MEFTKKRKYLKENTGKIHGNKVQYFVDKQQFDMSYSSFALLNNKMLNFISSFMGCLDILGLHHCLILC